MKPGFYFDMAVSDEIWRPVVGHENYEVSNFGRVRSLDHVKIYRHKDRWSDKILEVNRRHAGKILKPGRMQSGHLLVVLGRRRGAVCVHVLVLEAFVGPRPPGMDGCHKDGDPANNRLENLRWDTRSANILDDYTHGVRKRGPKKVEHTNV